MKILIKALDGTVYEITVEKDDLIEDVKGLVWAESGKTPDEQRLIFAGKQMEDGRTLADYNVYEEATIHMVTRLKGN
mgnify:FL=1